MSRQLDLQLYLALHGYKLKVIPEERFDDYMSEPCYSTDAEAMFELDLLMGERGWNKTVDSDIYGHVIVNYWNDDSVHQKAGYKKQQYLSAITAFEALTGKEWEGD